MMMSARRSRRRKKPPMMRGRVGMTTAAEDDLGDRFRNRAWEVVLAIVFRR